MVKQLLIIGLALASTALPQTALSGPVIGSDITHIAMLGTGTPNPFPNRSGPAIAIVVNDEPYLIDFGPGLGAPGCGTVTRIRRKHPGSCG